MRRLLSPRDLAEAIGVSESSLKRWTDAGRIQAVRTEGGHRRIPVSEAVRFIRESRQPIVKPEILGFPELAAISGLPPAVSADDTLLVHLRAGDASAARGLVLARYLSGESIASLCDGPMRYALERIGELWRHADDGIFIEHRATDICLQALAQVRAAMEPLTGAPCAVGGAPGGDPYLLPTFMAATVLSGEGYNAVNLGPDTPVSALTSAITHHAPRVLWLSVSSELTPEAAQDLSALCQREAAAGRAVVLGGRRRSQVYAPGARIVESMAELAAFGRGLLGRAND
jgi:excisionase family DNA binding protein